MTKQAIDDLTEAGVGLIYNTPNHKSWPGYLKMGWQTVARWPIYLKPLRPMRMLARRMRPVGVASLPLDTFFDATLLPWREFADCYAGELPGLIAGWEQRRRQVGLRTPRTLAYLDWRYGGHPAVDYRVFAWVDELRSKRLGGFAVLRPNIRYGWQELVLTELLLAEPRVDAGRRLLRQLTGHVRGDYLAAHFTPGTLEHQIMRRSGFVRVPRRGIMYTVRPLQSAANFCVAPDAWDLSLGDLEIF